MNKRRVILLPLSLLLLPMDHHRLQSNSVASSHPSPPIQQCEQVPHHRGQAFPPRLGITQVYLGGKRNTQLIPHHNPIILAAPKKATQHITAPTDHSHQSVFFLLCRIGGQLELGKKLFSCLVNIFEISKMVLFCTRT